MWASTAATASARTGGPVGQRGTQRRGEVRRHRVAGDHDQLAGLGAHRALGVDGGGEQPTGLQRRFQAGAACGVEVVTEVDQRREQRGVARLVALPARAGQRQLGGGLDRGEFVAHRFGISGGALHLEAGGGDGGLQRGLQLAGRVGRGLYAGTGGGAQVVAAGVGALRFGQPAARAVRLGGWGGGGVLGEVSGPAEDVGAVPLCCLLGGAAGFGGAGAGGVGVLPGGVRVRGGPLGCVTGGSGPVQHIGDGVDLLAASADRIPCGFENDGRQRVVAIRSLDRDAAGVVGAGADPQHRRVG
ncbi:MAG: hypothetical protein GEV09_20865 [Pseudonocardiaceae bacterium]|nr:hypothetical protein [Pseudonocardiaceae bacterium]